jgi:hypothetical protein
VATKLLRAMVVSVSHHPRNPASLAATLQSGVVLFWNTSRESLVGHRVVRSHTQALAHGSFHPYLPIFITLSQGGLVDIWHVPLSGPLLLTDLSPMLGTLSSLTAASSARPICPLPTSPLTSPLPISPPRSPPSLSLPSRPRALRVMPFPAPSSHGSGLLRLNPKP